MKFHNCIEGDGSNISASWVSCGLDCVVSLSAGTAIPNRTLPQSPLVFIIPHLIGTDSGELL